MCMSKNFSTFNSVMECHEKIVFEEWGLIPYAEAYRRQQELFDLRVSAKRNGEDTPCDVWVFCEHPPVITMGQHGNRRNLLYSAETLKARAIDFFLTDRGGDVTFHGPGQCVCYPLLDLERRRMGLRRYVELLEEVVIRTLSGYGIVAGRLPGASGVWIEPGTAQERKICAVDTRSSRYVTMHGIALNVNTDLSGFSLINPCGFTDKGVTSLARELGQSLDMERVKTHLRQHVLSLFS